MKNCTKHFWREKARAPVNVCPFRNRLFCKRSDIHCDVVWFKNRSFNAGIYKSLDVILTFPWRAPGDGGSVFNSMLYCIHIE